MPASSKAVQSGRRLQARRCQPLLETCSGLVTSGSSEQRLALGIIRSRLGGLTGRSRRLLQPSAKRQLRPAAISSAETFHHVASPLDAPSENLTRNLLCSLSPRLSGNLARRLRRFQRPIQEQACTALIYVGMRLHIPRMVLIHGLLTGICALVLATLGSEALNDPPARLVLIAVSSLWSAVGSGITAFLLLSMEEAEARSPAPDRVWPPA